MIEVKNLTKHFGDNKVLDRVSLSVGKREMLCLTGANGVGKTTLLRLLAGILKADSGTIVMDDMPVYDNNNVKQHVFYIPENPYFFCGAKAVDMGNYYSEIYKDFDIKKFTKLLEVCKIEAESRISRFSDNHKKLLMLVCALASEPQYLFCDKIVDDLNEVERQALINVLGEEMEKGYLTIVLGTDDYDFVKETFGNKLEETGYVLKEYPLGEN